MLKHNTEMEGLPKVDDKVLFDKTINTAAKALDLRSRRHELIVSNLANADTPDYKSFDLLIEKAIASQDEDKGQLQMKRTHTGHLQLNGGTRNNLQPYIVQHKDQNNLRGDGNTVDMDREMANLASNQLLYKVTTQLVGKKFQGLKNVIKGGNR